MTTAARRTAERDRPVSGEPPVSKALSDRIQADGEQVAHTLDPEREPGTVRYPDPHAPNQAGDPAVGAQSNAEIQMERRTDAGPRSAASDLKPGASPSLLLWGSGAVGVLFVVVILMAVV